MKNRIKSFLFQALIPLIILCLITFLLVVTEKTRTITIVLVGAEISFGFMFLGAFRFLKDVDKDPGSIFTGLSIAFLILTIGAGALSYSYDEIKIYKNSNTTYATIKNINIKTKSVREEDSNGNTYYEDKEYCEYEVSFHANDIEYNGTIDDDNCKKTINDKIKIYYLKDNPNIYRQNKDIKFKIIIIIMGIMSFIIGVYSLVVIIVNYFKPVKKKRYKK